MLVKEVMKMDTKQNVYKSISETAADATSSRSRVVAFLLAFLLPVGIHNYYLGYHIKGLAQTLVLFATVILMPSFIAVVILPFYIAWLTSEGLIFLLWYKVSDGDGFLLYDDKNPQKPNRQTTINLAFLLPFGLHNIYAGKLTRGVIAWGLVAIVISTNVIFLFFPVMVISILTILIVVIISWLEGLYMLINKT